MRPDETEEDDPLCAVWAVDGGWVVRALDDRRGDIAPRAASVLSADSGMCERAAAFTLCGVRGAPAMGAGPMAGREGKGRERKLLSTGCLAAIRQRRQRQDAMATGSLCGLGRGGAQRRRGRCGEESESERDKSFGALQGDGKAGEQRRRCVESKRQHVLGRR